jgi:hypothetical protein
MTDALGNSTKAPPKRKKPVLTPEEMMRKKFDVWNTPPELALAIVRDLARRTGPRFVGEGVRILDPGSGSGRFGVALRQVFPDATIVGVDIRANADSPMQAGGVPVYSDFMDRNRLPRMEPDRRVRPHRREPLPSTIRSRGIAERFIHKSLRLLRAPDAQLVFLLRLNYWGGQKRYETLWQHRKPILKSTFPRRPLVRSQQARQTRHGWAGIRRLCVARVLEPTNQNRGHAFVMVITQESIVRFWTKVDRRSDDECWLWRLKLTKHGYGRVKFNGRYVHAHRIAYELTYGVIPPGLEPDHLCRNRACSNPRHLEAVTRRENVRRGISPIARHAAATHCPQGTPIRRRKPFDRDI